jgi:hypothetical protein
MRNENQDKTVSKKRNFKQIQVNSLDMNAIFLHLLEIDRKTMTFETFMTNNQITVSEEMVIKAETPILNLDYFKKCFLNYLKEKNTQLDMLQTKNICLSFGYNFYCDKHKQANCDNYLICLEVFISKGFLDVKKFKPSNTQVTEHQLVQKKNLCLKIDIKKEIDIDLQEIPAFEDYAGKLELPLNPKIITTTKIQEITNLINDSLNNENGKRIFHLHSTTGKGKTFAMLGVYQHLLQFSEPNFEVFYYNCSIHPLELWPTIKSELFKEWKGMGIDDLNDYLDFNIPLVLFLDQIECLEPQEVVAIRNYIDTEKKNIILITSSSLNDTETSIHKKINDVIGINFNDSFTDTEFKFLMIKHQNYDEFFKNFVPKKFQSLKGEMDVEWAKMTTIDNFQESVSQPIFTEKFSLWSSLEEIFNITKKSPLLLTYLYSAGVNSKYNGRMDSLLNEFQDSLKQLYSVTPIIKKIEKITIASTAQKVYEIISCINNEESTSQHLIPPTYEKYFDKKFIIKEITPKVKLVCENEYYLDYITSIIINKIDQSNSTFLYFYKVSQTKSNLGNSIISGKYFELAVRLRFKQQNSKYEYFGLEKSAQVYSYSHFDILMENLSQNIKSGDSNLNEINATLNSEQHAIFMPNKSNEKFIDYMVIRTDKENKKIYIHCNQITISTKNTNFMTQRDFYMRFMKLLKNCKECSFTLEMEFGWSFPEWPKKNEKFKDLYKSHQTYFYFYSEEEIIIDKNTSSPNPKTELEKYFEEYITNLNNTEKTLQDSSKKMKENAEKSIHPITNSNIPSKDKDNSDMEDYLGVNEKEQKNV